MTVIQHIFIEHILCSGKKFYELKTNVVAVGFILAWPCKTRIGSRYNLKVEPKEFADRSDVRYKRKRR